MHEVKRLGSVGGLWRLYHGEIDAITFTSSKDITVHGYGINKLRDKSESLSGACQFIEGDDKTGKVLYSEDNVQIKDGQDQTDKRVFKFLFKEPIKIKKN